LEGLKLVLPLRHKGRFVLLLVWLVSAAYVLPFRLRGWTPHDEGVLALQAQYILDGGLPHRDFHEIYTGGFSYWNALAFRVLGVRMISPRLVLFLCFLAFVPAVYKIASRFGPPVVSGLITLLAVAWSLPNYSANSVSWYNLFLATWATLAFLRHVETGRRRWLFLAGALAGVSILFKITGAHLVAASLLFLVYRDQLSASEQERPGQRRLSGFLLFKASGLALFLTFLFLMVRDRLAEGEFLYFLVPSATISGFLISREYLEGAGPFTRRFSGLMGLILPMAAGVLLPIVLFLVPFALGGGMADFIRGVTVGTGAHVRQRFFLPTLSAFWPAVPYTAVLGAGSVRRFRLARPFLILLAAALAAALWLSGSSHGVYRAVWNSARFLGVSVVLAACLRLADAHRRGFWGTETRQKIFLLACLVAMLSLLQFPFAVPFYFFYFAPLVILAIFALAGSEPEPPRAVHAAAFAFYLLFALLRTNPSFITAFGDHFERFEFPAVLDLPRAGGFRVTAEDARVYRAVISLVQEKSGGRPIYAGPDSPQVHFLSGLADATPRDANAPRDPLQQPELLFQALREKDTRVVVLNRVPPFHHLRASLFQRFEELFPNSREIGRFVVRWKD
jgi:hypothetical protein